MLFTENNIQSSQIIIATHSPFIIHNNARRDDKVIILKKDEFDNVVIPDEQKFQNWTEEQVVKEAFNVDYVIDSDKRAVLLEGETDEIYYRKAFEVFDRTETDIEFNWVGRTNERGNVEFTGDSALNQTKNFLLANNKFLKNDAILLYDNDTNKPEEDFGKLKIRIMPKNDSNQLYKIGVENLLVLPSDFNKGDFYKTSTRIDKYGAESQISELDKTKLCDWICNSLTVEKQKEILERINNVIQGIV